MARLSRCAWLTLNWFNFLAGKLRSAKTQRVVHNLGSFGQNAFWRMSHPRGHNGVHDEKILFLHLY